MLSGLRFLRRKGISLYFVTRNSIFVFAKPTIGVYHICMPEGLESTHAHVLLGDTFRIFLSYTCWLSGYFLCSVIPINALYAFLVCTVPCPIGNKETNSQYDLRNLTSPCLDFPIESTRDFILQSGLFGDIIVVFGQDNLDIE